MEESSRLIGSRYRLRQKVGQGAMGVVWQAYDEQLHRLVAAKELLVLDSLDQAKIERAKARAMREARLAARLEHPNAIRVYDVVEEDGQPWLIMEYLPSRSLAAVIAEQGTLPPREVARIGCYTAAALAAAHRHGIQHRDVKPCNVLIGDQEVKITDFGISRATDDGTATATGTVGTPAFFSPEVARGEDAGLPSDVFSLGATLYNAVEGTPPFGAADNHIAMLHRVASGSIMPPANAGPLLSPVLFRLMATEPGRRPTMQEAVHLLAAVVNETPQVSEATAVIPATVELPVEALPEAKAKQEKRAAGAAAGAAAAGLVAAAAQAESAGLTAPGAPSGADETAEGETGGGGGESGGVAAAGTASTGTEPDAAEAAAVEVADKSAGAEATGKSAGTEAAGAEAAGKSAGTEAAGAAAAGTEAVGKSAGTQAAAESAAAEATGGEPSGDKAPDVEPADGETPDGEAPGGEAPGSEVPGGEAPGGEAPGSEVPGGKATGGNASGSEATTEEAASTGSDPSPTPTRQAVTASGQASTTSIPPAPLPTRPLPAAATPTASTPTYTPPPNTEPEENRRKFPVVPIAVVIVVLAVGVGAFLLWPKGDNQSPSNNPTASGTSAPPSTSQTQSQTQPQQPTDTPTQPQTNPPTNPQQNPPSTPNQTQPPQTAEQALTAYYALIPGDLQTGYSLLTDKFKASRARTFQEYQTFWSDFTSVQLSNIAPQGANVVSVTVTYMNGASVVTTERHTYTLVQQNGKWMIDNQVAG